MLHDVFTAANTFAIALAAFGGGAPMHRPRALAAVVVDSDPLVSSLPASATGRGNVSAAGVFIVGSSLYFADVER